MVLSVSFTIGGGFEEDAPQAAGRVAFGGVSLMLELDTIREHDADRTTRKVLIGIEEFVAVRYKRGLLHDRILLRTVSLGVLGGVPGSMDDMVVLRVARRDREQAEALVERLASALTDAEGRASPRVLSTV
jgi:hypothetical protein